VLQVVLKYCVQAVVGARLKMMIALKHVRVAVHHDVPAHVLRDVDHDGPRGQEWREALGERPRLRYKDRWPSWQHTTRLLPRSLGMDNDPPLAGNPA
jgi:hypothetical protein